MPTNRALIIFIKTPIPAFVKTRLIPRLNAETVALLYKAFIRDLHQNLYTNCNYDTWYAVAPENFDEKILSEIIELKKMFLQQGNTLGERMDNAFQTLFAAGYAKVVVIGSDIPSLSVSIIEQTFSKLDDFDCVLGPSEDGGYYLIALKRRYAFMFKGILWSSKSVLTNTLKIAKKNHITVYQQQILDDIDTYTSLTKFYNRLKTNKKLKNFTIYTWKILKQIYEDNNQN